MSETPQPPDGQCAFFLPKKRRFCRFRPNEGQKYCAEHACVMGVELERKRINCPLNPKHTCYEDNLSKHLKKCNSRKRNMEKYYEEGINTGSDEGDIVHDPQTAVKATSTDRLRQMIEKVNQLYEEHIGKLEEDIKSHQCLHEDMDNPYYGLPALRHRRQQASLIGQLEGLGLLAPGHCYVEMGAGKGQLSHWVRKAVSSHDDAAFLLVDRSSIRYKVDGYHKEGEKVKFERIKIDIEHLNLGKVPMVANSDRPLVAIGKHLCGAATDLTLRCLMKIAASQTSETATAEPSAKRQKMDCSLSSTKLQTSPPSRESISKNTSTRKGEENTSSSENGHVTSMAKQEEKGQNSKCCETPSDRQNDSVRYIEERKESCEGDGGASVSNTEGSSMEGSDVSGKNQLAGVLIALCCHHQCSWKAYVGKEFMRQCGITASDFNLLTRLTSWAVCGWRDKDGSFGTKQRSAERQKNTDTSVAEQEKESAQPSSADDNSPTAEENEHDTKDLIPDSNQTGSLQLSEKQKETVGWKCKRLIDYGRACYLKDCGLQARLKIYIDSQQTPENVVLIATPLEKS